MANLIFDFDGTMIESFPVNLMAFNKLVNLKSPITDREIELFRTEPVAKIIEYLELPIWKVNYLMVKGRREVTSHMTEIPFAPGVRGVILDAHTAGHKLFVVSSNSRKNINAYLTLHKVEHCFKKVYGGISFLGKDKAIKRVIRSNKLNLDETYYIGDEARDVKAAHKVGLKVIAVTWGFNAANMLNTEHPDYLIDTASQLRQIIIDLPR